MQSENEKIELEIEEFRKIFWVDILVNHQWNGTVVKFMQMKFMKNPGRS